MITLGPQRVAIHSAHVEPGAVFVALAGRRDGHDFVADGGRQQGGVRRSSTGAGRAPDPALPARARRRPAGRAAGARRVVPAAPDAHVVAVVGSLGKTTTKDALVSFLGESTCCYGSPGSFNSQLGVPLSVLWCPADAELAVFEAAATEPGEMARLVPRPAARHRSSSRPSATASAAASGRPTPTPPSCATLAAHGRHASCAATRTTDVAAYLPAGTATAARPASPEWPVTTASPGPAPARPSSSSTATASTSRRRRRGSPATSPSPRRPPAVLGHRPTTPRPTRRRRSTCRRGARRPACHVLRSAAVDEPMAWRTALADAFDAAGGRRAGCSSCSATPPTTMSAETLLTLAGITTERPWSVLVTAGRAADVLGRHRRVPLRVFDDDGRARAPRWPPRLRRRRRVGRSPAAAS